MEEDSAFTLSNSNDRIYDLTELIRRRCLDQNIYDELEGENIQRMKNACIIFNSGCINYPEGSDKYVITARCLFMEDFRIMSETNIPPMWETLSSSKGDDYISGWGSLNDYTTVLYAEIPSFENVNNRDLTKILSWDHIQTKTRETMSFEDPRVIKKSDGNIYISVTSTSARCFFNVTKWRTSKCTLMFEYPLLFHQQNKNIIKVGKPKKIPCLYNLRNDLEYEEWGGINVKNWSHWVHHFRDHYTDFFGDYTVYGVEGDVNFCKVVKIKDDEGYNFIKRLEKKFTYPIERTDGKYKDTKFFKFTTTTPSIRIPDELCLRAFGETGLFMGVAHVRSSASGIIKELYQSPPTSEGEEYKTHLQKTFNKIIEDINSEEEGMYSSFGRFVEKAINLTRRKLIYLHNDFYGMMMYVFNPSDGSIKYISNCFFPFAVNFYQGNTNVNLSSRFLLVFPVGLFFKNDEIFISYGEGDIRTRLLRMDISSVHFHNISTKEGQEKVLNDLKFIIKGTQAGNFIEKKTVKELIDIQYSNEVLVRFSDEDIAIENESSIEGENVLVEMKNY